MKELISGQLNLYPQRYLNYSFILIMFIGGIPG